VHVFWGALDLAVTRFSGRPAPLHPGGAPNCGPFVMHEAYSHEVSSAGFWPGGDGEGLFYSYAYPEPDGFRTADVAPDAARFDDTIDQALRDGDAETLATLDLERAAELWCEGAPGFRLLGEVARDRPVAAQVSYADAPYGVAWWVARWDLGPLNIS